MQKQNPPLETAKPFHFSSKKEKSPKMRQKIPKKIRHCSSSSSSAHPPPSPPPPADGPHSDMATAVDNYCSQILHSFTLGTPKKALKIMKDSISRYPVSPTLLRTQTYAYFHLSKHTTGSEKLKHLEKCVSCSKRALSLTPNAIGIYFIRVQSLLGLAKEESDYRRIVDECEHALAIEVFAAPRLDVWMFLKGDNNEENVKESIKMVMKTAKVALEGFVLKCGGRKVKGVSFDFDDERADRMVTLEEETKIQELRRREITEKIDFLRDFEKGRVFGGERRETARKLGTKESVLEYWNGRMSMEDKRRVLRVSVEKMREHYSKDKEVKEILKEAVEFVTESGRWKVWKCCCCGNWFREGDTLMGHVVLRHLKILSKEHQELVPQEVDPLWAAKIENGVWKPVDVDRTVGMAKENLGLDEERWIYCDDVERKNLLGQVKIMLKWLLKHECLTTTTMEVVMNDAVAVLESAIPDVEVLISGFSKTPMYLCFLGCEQLKQICHTLTLLFSEFSFMARTGEKSSFEDDEQCSDKEFISFTSDFSSIILNKTLCKAALDREKYTDSAVVVDGTAAVSFAESIENDASPGSDSLIHWLFTGPEIRDQVKLWTILRDSKMKQAMEGFCFLEKEFAHLELLCERKIYFINYIKAASLIEDICIEEGKKRAENKGYDPQGYVLSLLKRCQELRDQPFVWNVLLNVMREALDFCGDEVQIEAAWTFLKNQLSYLECDGEVEQRIQDMMLLEDDDVTRALLELRSRLTIEFCRVDVLIMRSVTATRRMGENIEWLSACDYHAILLHLLKSFLQTHLEDLVYKDAKEKADAVKETFLAELALETGKNMHKESDNTKKFQQNLKSKKRKDHKKATDKAYGGSEGCLSLDEKCSEICLPITSNDACSDSDNIVSQQDEALRGTMEDQTLEVELFRRKLDEVLEYQRQYENELKDLALKTVKSGRTIVENVVTHGVPLVCSETRNVDGLCNPVLKQPERVTFPGGYINFGSLKVTDFDYSWYHAQRSTSDVPYSKSGEKNASSECELLKHSEPVNLPSNASSLASWEETCSNHPVEMDGLKKFSGNSDMVCSSEIGEMSHDYDEKSQLDSLVLQTESLKNLLDVGLKPEEVIIDMNHTEKNFPLEVEQKLPQLSMKEEPGMALIDLKVDNMDGSDVQGAGMNNDSGEYICFLSVIMQSLWHLRQFRDEFVSISASSHRHVGDPCVVCGLSEVFVALSAESTGFRNKHVTPTSLRIALEKLCSDSNLFQEEEMNDAADVLAIIFYCIHQSVASSPEFSHSESEGENWFSFWDCTNGPCLAHRLFSLEITESMNCECCGLESRNRTYTSFFHDIKACALRQMKIKSGNSTFDELLKLVDMNRQFPCGAEAGGCGKLNYIHYFLETPPHVFMIVLGWQSSSETVEDIRETLAILTTEIDIGVLYRGSVAAKKYCLISMVCCYAQHNCCFVYSKEQKRWMMYDDALEKIVGDWSDVLAACVKLRLQPHVLFFEAAQ